MKRHGGIVNACCYVKEASLKMLHHVWFQLYDILEKAKSCRQWKVSGCQGLVKHRGYFRQRYCSVQHCNGRYTTLHIWQSLQNVRGFPGSSAGKKSTCNCRNPWFDSWVRKFPWRRDRLPTPVFLGFPGGSMVKNPPAMWETWVWSLAWEDPLEEGMATHSSILAWRIPVDRGAWQVTVHGVTKSQTPLSD